jgi:hypothetical protein
MKRMTVGVLMVAFLTIAGCSSVTVKSDYDTEVDFTTFKTYRWVQEKVPGDELAQNPLLQKRVKASVDVALQAKGFILEETGDPDIVVVTHAGTKEKMQVTDWGGYYRYDPWWGPYGGSVDVSYYTEGTLVIDIVDARERELVWRGVGTGIVREYSSGEKTQKALDEVVAEILKDFPPQ